MGEVQPLGRDAALSRRVPLERRVVARLTEEDDMGSEEERARFLAWWAATGGGNTSLRAVAEQAFLCAARLERIACISICREVAERYPTDIFPEDGESLDCKSARMARLTAGNIEREIAERHNA